jgi:hypothetical protein
MDWLTLVGGLGIGTLITSVANQYLTQRAASRNRLYQEKREVYLGLLSALHDAAVKPSDERSKAYALWQTRCELFGASEVSRYVQEIADTDPGSSERQQAFQNLVRAMKSDLGA